MKKTIQGLIGTGTVINENYVILELIGKGGMGEVYRAHQLNLKRDVAIKVVSQKYLKSLDADDQEIETASSRFRREVRAMAQVRHPNVVQIFDYGSAVINKGDEEVPIEYIVMEYIPGATLRFTMPEEGFYPLEDNVSAWMEKYFFPVLDGVQVLHEAGVIHRDLKPENFLLDGNIPKITDFGLARSLKLESVTESMDVVGTPPYMAPDQFYDFKRVDQRGDVYSLGKILFEAVEGKMPPTTIPFKSAKLNKANTAFFQALDRIIENATAEDKDSRLESVKKFHAALQEAIDGFRAQTTSPVQPSYRERPGGAQSRWLRVGIAVAIFSMAAMTVWHLAGNPWGKPKPIQEGQSTLPKTKPPTTGGPSGSEQPAPAKSIMGKDGIGMYLIPGGTLRIETNGGQEDTVQLQPFYMDETKVSVEQFVEFLNSVKQELTVEDGVVKHAGEIWILLGEESETEGQIIYRHDRFHIRDLKKAAQPVVRVTWYGARAYARYFDKRLPTEYEWEYAAQSSSRDGLKNMGGNIKEWVVSGKKNQESGGQIGSPQGETYYSSLEIGESSPPKEPGVQKTFRNFRYPWEGFFDVGFRCVALLSKS
jgi:serine/threonine protein kinase